MKAMCNKTSFQPYLKKNKQLPEVPDCYRKLGVCVGGGGGMKE